MGDVVKANGLGYAQPEPQLAGTSAYWTCARQGLRDHRVSHLHGTMVKLPFASRLTHHGTVSDMKLVECPKL